MRYSYIWQNLFHLSAEIKVAWVRDSTKGNEVVLIQNVTLLASTLNLIACSHEAINAASHKSIMTTNKRKASLKAILSTGLHKNINTVVEWIQNGHWRSVEWNKTHSDRLYLQSYCIGDGVQYVCQSEHQIVIFLLNQLQLIRKTVNYSFGSEHHILSEIWSHGPLCCSTSLVCYI